MRAAAVLLSLSYPAGEPECAGPRLPLPTRRLPRPQIASPRPTGSTSELEAVLVVAPLGPGPGAPNLNVCQWGLYSLATGQCDWHLAFASSMPVDGTIEAEPEVARRAHGPGCNAKPRRLVQVSTPGI